MEKLNYKIDDSTISELLGVQNFSTDDAAVLELVKNAYDAKAIHLKITFTGNQMEILDDGEGMDDADIRNHWMYVGVSDKKYDIVDENNVTRIQAGSKGVGRFALSRLGGSVMLVSKKKNQHGVIWRTDWKESTLEIDSNIKTTGTQIIIENLRVNWNKKRVSNLIDYLSETYNDNSMSIEVCSCDYNEYIECYYKEPQLGINCKSYITLRFDKKILEVDINQDEFRDDAKRYCGDLNIKNHHSEINVLSELKGNKIYELIGDNYEDKYKTIEEVGEFSAKFLFNVKSTNEDADKFLYKYASLQNSPDGGVALFRNAFSIATFEGKRDWLGFGKRSRKSPAAATHETGAWRLKENQISGYVSIDKRNNCQLKDLANRQGLDENIYFLVFVEIILIGIGEFERYRQSIIRKIDKKNTPVAVKPKNISSLIIKNPSLVGKLSSEQASQLLNEIKEYQESDKQNNKEKKRIESRYRYDVRILNLLATQGLKAASIAHELNNSRNNIDKNYDNIVSALKNYDVWDLLNRPENTSQAYKNVPLLLESNKKIDKQMLSFMDTMLTEIEKKQFIVENQNILNIMEDIKNIWIGQYNWIQINFHAQRHKNIEYNISKDVLEVIFNNLILNSVQQNDKVSRLTIDISISLSEGFLFFDYKDDGHGLDRKYLENPMRILEVHETSRKDGHGLGMWIVNNTAVLTGGKINEIQGDSGFRINFTLGDKYNE